MKGDHLANQYRNHARAVLTARSLTHPAHRKPAERYQHLFNRPVDRPVRSVLKRAIPAANGDLFLYRGCPRPRVDRLGRGFWSDLKIGAWPSSAPPTRHRSRDGPESSTTPTTP